MPWKLYADAAAYIFTWLIGYSSLMGAIGGILIADYWILRRPQLSLPDLFKPNGRYAYTAASTSAAMIALVSGGRCRSFPASSARRRRRAAQVANPTFFDSLYTYAWFVTFGLSFVLYLILARRR